MEEEVARMRLVEAEQREGFARPRFEIFVTGRLGKAEAGNRPRQ
jgi:hypothetical protein